MCMNQWCPCGWPEGATYEEFMSVWTVGMPLAEEKAIETHPEVFSALQELDTRARIEKVRRRKQQRGDY